MATNPVLRLGRAAWLNMEARKGSVLVFDPNTGDLAEAESVCVNGHAVQVNLHEREAQWVPVSFNGRIGPYHVGVYLSRPGRWSALAYHGPSGKPSRHVPVVPNDRFHNARSAMLAAEAAVRADQQAVTARKPRRKPRNRRKP